MNVSFYPNKQSLTPTTLPLQEILTKVKTSYWREYVDPVREKKAPKDNLPCYTTSGTFNGKKSADCLVQHSGIIAVDLDVKDNRRNLQEARPELEADPYTYALHDSASGTGGLVVYVRIKPDKDTHTVAYKALGDYYLTKYNLVVDQSGSNVNRLRFVSIDPGTYINEGAKTFSDYTRAEPKPKKEVVSTGDSCIDDYNQRTDVWDLLSNEFTVTYKAPNQTLIKRHGTEAKYSGYIYHDSGCAFLFTDSTKYPSQTLLSPFDVYTIQNHGGDKSAAAKELYKQGYGQRIEKPKKEEKTLIKEQETEALTALQLFNRADENIPMLLGEIIPKVGTWSLVGSSDTGKSMLLRQLAIAVTREAKFLDWPLTPTHRKVVFVSTEDDERATSYLVRKQSQGNIRELQNLRFVFDPLDTLAQLEHVLSTEPADLVIIDAWSDVFGQNLNDSNLIRLTLNDYKRLAEKHQCSIGFLHHTGKRTEKLAPSKNNILSGQGFEAKMRLVIELRTDKVDADKRHFCIVKGNYLGKDYKNSSFVLQYNPDKFLFSPTGERTDFEDLAILNDAGKEIKRIIKPEDMDEAEHTRVLLDVFNGKELGVTELKTRMSDHYGKWLKTQIGGRVVDKFLTYLTTDVDLIIDNGEKVKSPNRKYRLK